MNDGHWFYSRKSVTMGVNAVTRDLEKDNLCSVLLESNVESLLIKHVVVMAQNKSIPVVLVPFVKKATLEHIGFASAAIGLKVFSFVQSIDGSAFSVYHEINFFVFFNRAIPPILTDHCS